MPSASPEAIGIASVERAISALRRGEAVLLSQGRYLPLMVRSGEHYPDFPVIDNANHPAVQLMKFAGLLPRAVVEPFKGDEALLLGVSAEAITQYPAALAESLVEVSEAPVPMAGAENARVIAFRPRFGHEEHLAVVVGSPLGRPAPLVRIHSSCVTGDVFGSLRCDCGGQLKLALQTIAAAGDGAIVYLSQEGRGIGIANKLRAYRLQDAGLDTVEANEALGFAPDERDFALAARMLKMLGLHRITLLTNNPDKVESITRHGIEVAARQPLIAATNPHNRHYLETKALKLRHQF